MFDAFLFFTFRLARNISYICEQVKSLLFFADGRRFGGMRRGRGGPDIYYV